MRWALPVSNTAPRWLGFKWANGLSLTQSVCDCWIRIQRSIIKGETARSERPNQLRPSDGDPKAEVACAFEQGWRV